MEKKHLEAQINKYFQSKLNHIMYSKLLYRPEKCKIFNPVEGRRIGSLYIILFNLKSINQSNHLIQWASYISKQWRRLSVSILNSTKLIKTMDTH